ncbi:hypothetical protein WG66_011033 [Moniliophthora roreri]|nr:hypothetical protein WG66_011033 [Moniliophthora roreri]
MSIHDSQLSVTGTLNNVNGDQVNVHIHRDDAKVTECTIFGQFENVKRGHVIGMKELYSEDLSEWDWHWQNGELFTAITYEGEGAQEAWEDDFRQFSRASRTGLFQLFGISQSEVPMLIFHHELIPVAHFYTKSLWMDIYMDYLLVNEGCREEDLWMDTRRGILCSGPTGPHVSFPLLPKDDTALQALPSTLDMLEEGNSVAFFSKFGSNVDRGVLACAWEFRERTYLDNLFPKTTEDHQHEDNSRSQLTTDHPYLWRNSPHDLPIDIGGLHFDTVYSSSLEPVARWPPEAPGLWMLSDVNGLVEETRIDGGLTRWFVKGRKFALTLNLIGKGSGEVGYHNPPVCLIFPR